MLATSHARHPLVARLPRVVLHGEERDRLMVGSAPATAGGAFGPPRLVSEGTSRLSENASVDGNGRFLRIQSTVSDDPVTRIEVVLNWKPIVR